MSVKSAVVVLVTFVATVMLLPYIPMQNHTPVLVSGPCVNEAPPGVVVAAQAAIPPPSPVASNSLDLVEQSRVHLASLGVTIKPKEKWYLGVCSGTRSSGAWLREWIELQILAGIDHLWLVNDNNPDTEDGTAAIIQFYEALGFVSVIPGRMPTRHPGCGGVGPHKVEQNCAAPKHCADHMAHLVKWWIFADTDEFAYPHVGCSLSDFVRKTCDPKRAAVYIRWERFGTSGHNLHPAGLLTENFLSSGGDCSTEPESPSTRPVCKEKPFMFCAECRHHKVMHNSGRCTTVDHVSWVHWIGNTSSWKKKHGADWRSSPGTKTLPFKNKDCFHIEMHEMSKQCDAWIADPARREHYSKECCEAGIGYNHYGTKSRQFYESKQKMNRSVNPRGFRAKLDILDLNDFLSSSILRFVRALRKRMIMLGKTPAHGVKFISVPHSKNKTGTCFVESGYLYSGRGVHEPPLEATKTIEATDVATSDACCAHCLEVSGCQAWTFQRKCKLLIPSKMAIQVGLGKRDWPRPIPKLVEATRQQVIGAVSGIVVKHECHA
eukprot:gene14229-21820_t